MLDPLLVGFERIAEALRTSPRQVLIWATRARDPLRLMVYHGIPQTRESRLRAWHDRYLERPTARVHGWRDIAARVQMSRMAAIRASEREQDPLPVVRAANGAVWAHADALADWKDAHLWPYAVHRAMRKRKSDATG